MNIMCVKLLTILLTLKYDAGWLIGLIWPFFIIRKHATLKFMHVILAHILQAGLAPEWCEKTPVLSLQLWTLKASKMLGVGLVILWH